MTAPPPQDVAVALLVGAALVTDVRASRIPNALTFGGMAMGLVFGAMDGRLGQAVLGILVAFALCFPSWLFFRAIRAGDAKLLMAVGAFWGPGLALLAVLATYVLSIPYGLVILAVRGRLANVGRAARHAWDRLRGREGDPPEATVRIFAPVVACAVLAARVMQIAKVTPW